MDNYLDLLKSLDKKVSFLCDNYKPPITYDFEDLQKAVEKCINMFGHNTTLKQTSKELDILRRM